MMWSSAQEQSLRQLMRHATTPHVRVKAVALWNVGHGRSQGEVAQFLGVGLRSVNRWVQRFRREGTRGLNVKPGRGRRPRADLEELALYVKQSPRNFGVERTRWTLKALAAVVPSLKGFSEAGVWDALRRTGFAYKRGQPTLHSPDPEYEKKGPVWLRRFEKQEKAPGR